MIANGSLLVWGAAGFQMLERGGKSNFKGSFRAVIWNYPCISVL